MSAPVVLHVASGLGRNLGADQPADHMERGIETRTDASRSDDPAVVDDPGPRQDLGAVQGAQFFERAVVSGCGQAAPSNKAPVQTDSVSLAAASGR